MAKQIAAVPCIQQGEVRTLYVDNLIVTSLEQARVASVVLSVQQALEDRGLAAHKRAAVLTIAPWDFPSVVTQPRLA